MKINWKLRIKNKVTLTALVMAVIAFVYQMLGIFGIVVPVSQSDVVNLASLIITILVSVGVVVDPTTSGAGDSDKALGYEEPYKEKKEG